MNASNSEPPITIVIFGATGDLTQRKLVPALYNAFRKGRVPEGTRIVGYARRPLSNDDFRARMRSVDMTYHYADAFGAHSIDN